MNVTTRTFRIAHDEEPERILRGRIDAPAQATTPLPFVLVLHGFKGFMNWGFFPELSRRIASAGLVAVSFNMSGSGVGEDLENFTEEEAFAHNTYTRELEDTERVRSFITAGGVAEADPARAGLFGHSLGGGIGLLHASERGDYEALVTWAAVARLNRFDQATCERWRRDGMLLMPNARTGQDHRLDIDWLVDAEQNSVRFDIEAACGRLQAPTLLVHGTADEAVGLAEAKSLDAALRPDVGHLLTIEGAGHTFGAAHPFTGVSGDLKRALEATIDHFATRLARA